jgi:hypothetical protein
MYPLPGVIAQFQGWNGMKTPERTIITGGKRTKPSLPIPGRAPKGKRGIPNAFFEFCFGIQEVAKG